MNVAAAEVGGYFSLGEEIGTIPRDGIIFQPESSKDLTLFNTDEFRTRVVLKQGVEEYDPQLLHFLFGLSRVIDDRINQNADLFPFALEKPPDGVKRGLARLHTPEIMAEKQQRFIQTIKEGRSELVKNGRDAVMAFPLWGSVAIMRAMEREGVPQDLLVPASISGSLGTITGFAEAGELPESLTNPKNIVMAPDDIYDTCVTLIQLAIQRAQRKASEAGIKTNHNIFDNPKNFEEKMRQARRGELEETEQKKVWTELAQLLWETDVISAPFSIKNPPFAEAVITLASRIWADPDSSDWDRIKAAIQGQLMFQTHYINPNHWIVGGRWGEIPLLDTKVRGKSIMEELATKQGEYGLSQWQIEQLQQTGFADLNLRTFSGLDGLWVFNPDGVDGGVAFGQLVGYYAAQIANYTNERWSTGE